MSKRGHQNKAPRKKKGPTIDELKAELIYIKGEADYLERQIAERETEEDERRQVLARIDRPTARDLERGEELAERYGWS